MNEIKSAKEYQDEKIKKYHKDIIEMVKNINNVDNLIQIYYFALVKYERDREGVSNGTGKEN